MTERDGAAPDAGPVLPELDGSGADRGGGALARDRGVFAGRRLALAGCVSAVFCAVVLVNLLVPAAKGPPDNGDFKRIFAAFSSGPVGLDFWPSDPRSDAFARRFFSFYEREWRLDDGVPELARWSSSNLLFLPARAQRAAGRRVFDLGWNAALVTLGLGGALFAALALLRGPVPFAALSAFALVTSDANVSGYLNSFYQDAGALAYFLLYVCALFVFWQKRTIGTFVLAVACCILVAWTKFAYLVAAAPLIVPVLAGAACADWPARRRGVAIASACCAIALSIGLGLRLLSDETVEKPAAYHFVFAGALPALPKNEQAPYLAALGLGPQYLDEYGRNAWDPAGHFTDRALQDALGTPFLVRAISVLVRDHPASALRVAARALSGAGTYPGLLYRDATRRSGEGWALWSGWSWLHRVVLRGFTLYALGCATTLVLALGLTRRPSRGWRLFFALVTASFVTTSILEALVAMFGNGAIDLQRHDFLATLVMDAALVTGAAGLWLTARTAALRSVPPGA